MVSAAIVNGFNNMADYLQAAGKYVPQPIVSGIKAFSEQVQTDGFKTFVVNPVTLLSSILKFTGRADLYPALAQFAKEGCWVKSIISVSEVFTKLPGVCQSLSASVSEDNPIDRQCWFRGMTGGAMYGYKEPAGAAVASRIFTLASWCISVGDAIGMAGRYRPLPKLLRGATPWIYSIAGGYMGAQSAYAEVRFQHSSDNWKHSTPGEKCLGVLNLATSINYCCLAAGGFLGLYHKDNKPEWLSKWQFVFTVGTTVLPAAQKCAREWLHPSTKKAP
jgi:hypothetical protein